MHVVPSQNRGSKCRGQWAPLLVLPVTHYTQTHVIKTTVATVAWIVIANSVNNIIIIFESLHNK